MRRLSVFLLLFFLLLQPVCFSYAEDLPADGTYLIEAELEGGSGRAWVESPCLLTVSGGLCTIRLAWSSPNYDYMIAGGETFLPVNETGNSVFLLPLASLSEPLAVQADTTAMGTPHLIDYVLRFDPASLRVFAADGEEEAEETKEDVTSGEVPADGGISPKDAEHEARAEEEGFGRGKEKTEDRFPEEAPSFRGLTFESMDENDYAACFRIYRYADGYALLAVDDGRQYLLVPEGGEIPEETGEAVVLVRPLDRIYLAATAAMCQFDVLDAVGAVLLSGTQAEGWYIEAARKAMEEGRLLYGGKYSAPDYELIVAGGVDLAVESTMILHVPKVQEKLEQLGVPVFIDRSSYEEEPLGRSEWVRVYGLLTDREEEAAQVFEKQKEAAQERAGLEISGKTVAVFSVNSKKQIVTRRPNDYFAAMIEQAGGVYVTPAKESGSSAVSTVTVGIEEFYAAALEADILIYNASIENAPASIEDLVASQEVLGDFKAVKTGDVWCTEKSLYQHANAAGTMIRDLGGILSGETDTEYFYKLQQD